MRQVLFDEHELNLIFEDQRAALEKSHIGIYSPKALQNCPFLHFIGLDFHEYMNRQSIMNKILNDAAET